MIWHTEDTRTRTVQCDLPVCQYAHYWWPAGTERGQMQSNSFPGDPPKPSARKTGPFGEHSFWYSACADVCTQVDSMIVPKSGELPDDPRQIQQHVTKLLPRSKHQSKAFASIHTCEVGTLSPILQGSKLSHRGFHQTNQNSESPATQAQDRGVFSLKCASRSKC